MQAIARNSTSHFSKNVMETLQGFLENQWGLLFGRKQLRHDKFSIADIYFDKDLSQWKIHMEFHVETSKDIIPTKALLAQKMIEYWIDFTRIARSEIGMCYPLPISEKGASFVTEQSEKEQTHEESINQYIPPLGGSALISDPNNKKSSMFVIPPKHPKDNQEDPEKKYVMQFSFSILLSQHILISYIRDVRK